MKLKLSALALALALTSGIADARGGMSGGGGRGGFSGGGFSGSRSVVSAPMSRPNVTPVATPRPAMPAPQVASARPNSAPVVQPGVGARTVTTPGIATAGARSTTTTTTNTTTSYSRNVNYGGGMMYGGFGMGYGYSNGLLTGMIIGNMLHPYNTVVYTGGGAYANNALLYPDGRVVNQQGYQVGTYVNGVFTPVNGGMVAQAVPADAYAQAPAQPVVIKNTTSDVTILVLSTIAIMLFFILLLMML